MAWWSTKEGEAWGGGRELLWGLPPKAPYPTHLEKSSLPLGSTTPLGWPSQGGPCPHPFPRAHSGGWLAWWGGMGVWAPKGPTQPPQHRATSPHVLHTPVLGLPVHLHCPSPTLASPWTKCEAGKGAGRWVGTLGSPRGTRGSPMGNTHPPLPPHMAQLVCSCRC